MFAGLTTTKVSSNAPKSQDKSTFKQFIEMKGVNAAKLQTLCDCLAMNIPVLITTDDPPRMIRTLSFIASVAGQEMSRILLSERSDTTQLLGCFEQTSTDLSSMVQLL
jgi:midasin (ATPase involved in ribosome maturation)